MAEQRCPRRDEGGVASQFPGPDEYVERDGVKVCSFCGSICPGDLFELIEDGAELGPTDKNYKAYVRHERAPNGKFYFQHLDSPVTRKRFIDLHNEGKMKIGYPGHFYVLPFFMRRASGVEIMGEAVKDDDG